MPRTVAYTRISTDEQDLENQKIEIESYAQAKNISIDEWVSVEMSSRKDIRARRINELIRGLRRGDRLIVSELSRLARSMRETHNIMHDLSKKRIEVHVIKQNLVMNDNDIATKIYINSFAMAAEIERDLISQRTKNGMALARKRGKQIGNPNLRADNQKRIEKADKFAEGLRTIITGFIQSGLTQRKIVDELNKHGIKTSRGHEWNLTTVQRLLKRLNLKTIKTKKEYV